jgi:broad specificity phosphatase PhoE
MRAEKDDKYTMNNHRPPPPQAPTSQKTIYLIRHGVAKHNIPNPETGERPDIANDATLTDPPLVRQGVLQAQVLGENLRRMGVNETIDLVICSPLTRCMQTAGFVFPDHLADVSNMPNNIISTYTEVEDPERRHHIVLNGSCRVFCHEDVREAFGMHYPDKRR